jgi:5S rRNA maturation endonuclease (ribonuclease M5)
MTDLDQQTQILRKQLAGKLAQQNTYLKRMLKRYERS